MAELGYGPTVSLQSLLLDRNVTGEKPKVEIIEQPAPRTLRFRYECEGRLAGCLTGINSTPENKTFPTIQVKNYQGPAVVIVSCVTKDAPHYPHPHRIVGKEGCKDGIYRTEIRSPDMIQSFTGLGIQCVKKKHIEASLNDRESRKVDPFHTGFEHKTQSTNIDLNVVRLCFQVILLTPCKKRKCLLEPIVSDPIYDKKAHSDLSIHKLSHYTAPVSGGAEVILLCERVNKDVQIRFFERKGEKEVWSANAEFQPSDVHKQYAISFRTPRYYNLHVSHEVNVWIQLVRSSDNAVGVPRKFQLLPIDRDPESLARKRVKFEERCCDDYIKSMSDPENQGAVIRVPRHIQQRPVRFRVKHEATSATTMHKTLPSQAMSESTGMHINPMGPFTGSQFRADGAPIAHFPMPPMVPSMENIAPPKLSTEMMNIPHIDYHRADDRIPNRSDHSIRTIPVASAVPYCGGTLVHSFPPPMVNNLGQKFPTATHHNNMLSPNVPPLVLSDESNSSPPSPASLKAVPSTSGLQQNNDHFNSELQMSVEDATERLGSLTVDPDMFQLPSDASISGSDWINLNPTLPYNSDQNFVDDYMVSEGGNTDETLQQAKTLERALAELEKVTDQNANT